MLRSSSLLLRRGTAAFPLGTPAIDSLPPSQASQPSGSSGTQWTPTWASPHLHELPQWRQQQQQQQQRREASSSSAASEAAAASHAAASTSAPSAAAGATTLLSHTWQAPSYEQVMREYAAMEAAFHKVSQLDGSKRRPLSTNVLRFPIPPHEIEPGLMSMDVYLRPDYGTLFCKWLRKTDRVPGRVTFNQNVIQHLTADPQRAHTTLLVHFAKKDVDRLVRESGRQGCEARVVQLRVLDPENPAKVLALIRAKPHQARCNAASLAVENLDLVHVRQSDLVHVSVPIKPINQDASPGVRKGGWLMMLKRAVKYQCRSTHIPPFIPVDAKALELGGEVRVRDLLIPNGTRLMRQDFNALVLKCTTEGGDEVIT